ncbi:MAG: hypothetical protein K0R69_307 [Clostridia bacterium]|jgi:hypothetical protein|nr:hypothetical protein [Clostridia bacterium]
MNRKIKVILAAGMLLFTTLYAADSGPGTSSDPLVTKSYVDKKVAEVSGGSNVSGSLTEQLKAQEQLINTLLAEITALKQNSNTYKVVSVPEGKLILGKQGSEMIVRAGEAQVISAEAGGLQDMTAGADINAGSIAPKYHLLIIPREDGRGLLATKTLTVMVRGGYTVQ